MELFVNDEKLDITLEGEKTVGEVLSAFEKDAQKDGLAVVGITIDGTQVPKEKIDQAKTQSLENVHRIDLNVVSEKGIASTFKNIAEQLETVASLLEQVPAFFQSGADSKARAAIADLADTLDKFCYAVTISAVFPLRFGKIKVEGKSLSDFFSDFMPIFNDLNGALETGDTVLLGDLAEYEISPRLKLLSAAVKDL